MNTTRDAAFRTPGAASAKEEPCLTVGRERLDKEAALTRLRTLLEAIEERVRRRTAPVPGPRRRVG